MKRFKKFEEYREKEFIGKKEKKKKNPIKEKEHDDHISDEQPNNKDVVQINNWKKY